MARRTLRTAAVAALAAGCLLSSMPAAWAGGVSGPPTTGVSRCPRPPAAPNLPAGDPGSDLMWPQSKLGLGPAGVWYLTRGKGVTVAVIDTGIDKGNPVFGPDTLLPGPSVVDPGGTAEDDCDGHGTAVAALIAGREKGLFGFMGVAPDATVLPIRLTYQADRPGSPVKLADAIRTATYAGARVINISIGTTQDSPELHSAVLDALAHDVVVVAAVGGDAQKNIKSYPAAIPGVLAVGAVDRTGSAAPFAQQGTAFQIAAPGGRMAVPAAGFPGALTASQGPGFSSAFVAGTAALVLSYRPNLHNWQVVQRLKATADRPASDEATVGSTLGPNAGGPAVVDPYRAVTVALASEGSRPDPSVGPGDIVMPPAAAVPGHDRTAENVALGVAGGGVLVLAIPVATAALRRGRIRGTRAGA